jgi:hypothetical protein
LSGIEKDLGPTGFAVIEAAVNDNADVPGFIRTYNPPFPVGTASGLGALEYMQWPPSQRPLVPLMAFVDRTGVIRAQYSGVDTNFFDDDMDKHIREEAEKLLKEGAPRSTKSSGTSKSKKAN